MNLIYLPSPLMSRIKISALPVHKDGQSFLRTLMVLCCPLLHLLSAPSSADQKPEFTETDPRVRTISSLISFIHQENNCSSGIKIDPTAKESKGRAQPRQRPFSSCEINTQPLIAAPGQKIIPTEDKGDGECQSESTCCSI